ncbi:MAG: histidine phosphatase family protein [Pseudomonadota bacterium]|nr:histidine phosphatase family protein [Pseudomonadota bacterium]
MTPTHLLGLPPQMLSSLAVLPSAEQPLMLLTRHSIREQVAGQGFASYALPLTDEGRQLAQAWGQHLLDSTGREIVSCLSSPIQRCVDTASLMLQGQTRQMFPITPIDQHVLLVEPGSFVHDVAQAGPLFREYGPLGFINAFLRDDLPGMKDPQQGVLDILALLHQYQPTGSHRLSLAVSHDTILAALLAVMVGQRAITWADWPAMMEGVFMWFEGDDFESSRLYWIWRGQLYQQPIAAFKVVS